MLGLAERGFGKDGREAKAAVAAVDWMKVLRFMVSGSFQVNSRVSTRRLRPLLATRS